jgi:hypothetical protein
MSSRGRNYTGIGFKLVLRSNIDNHGRAGEADQTSQLRDGNL